MRVHGLKRVLSKTRDHLFFIVQMVSCISDEKGDDQITDNRIGTQFLRETMTGTLNVKLENLQREEADMEQRGSQMTLILL